jgi:hypothetical protein
MYRGSSFSSGNHDTRCRIAALAIIYEIATENDDDNGTGDVPMRAAVGSEPFLEPSAQHRTVVANNRAADHVYFPCFVMIIENILGRVPFHIGRNRRHTSLIVCKFISLRTRRSLIAAGIRPAMSRVLSLS